MIHGNTAEEISIKLFALSKRSKVNFSQPFATACEIKGGSQDTWTHTIN